MVDRETYLIGHVTFLRTSLALILALIREESQYYRSSAKGQGVFINHAASNSNLQL